MKFTSTTLPSLQWVIVSLTALIIILTALALVWGGGAPASAQNDNEPQVPAKPAGLEVSTQQGSLDVALDWDDVDGAGQYLVRWRQAGADSKLNEGIRVDASSATITVANYGDWVVRLEACNNADCGRHLAQRFTVEPAPDSTPEPTPAPTPGPVPAQPANLEISTTAGALDVSLDWDDVDGADSYLVRWREFDGRLEENRLTPTVSNADITVADYGHWVVRLEACNGSGCGEPLAVAFRVEPPPNRAPVINEDADNYDKFIGSHNAPRGILVHKWFEGIFTDPDGDELTYSVSIPENRAGLVPVVGVHNTKDMLLFQYDADGDWGAVTPELANPLVTEVTLTATDPGRLSASLTGQFSAHWERLPGQPANLNVALAGEGSGDSFTFTLTWDAPADGGAASGYRILRRAADTEPAFTVLADDTGDAGTTYGDATAKANTKYVYRVKAVNSEGAGPASRPAEITHLTKPGRPSGLSANLNNLASVDGGGFSVTLSWTAPADGGEATGYEILRRDANGTSGLSVLVDNTGNAETTYIDAAVAGDRKYIYRVKARNADGVGAASNPVQVVVLDYNVKTLCGYECNGGIHAIYNPKFMEADDERMSADERVIGVSINGEARAYSVPYLHSHEVVNDTVGGVPITVTYCPLCMTTIVYERTIDGTVYQFGVSGKLMKRGSATDGCLVLYDKQTESLWSQVIGFGVSGEHNGVELNVVPSAFTTWENWVELHPNTKALRKPRKRHNVYPDASDPDYNDWAAVARVKTGNKVIAYPYSRMSNPNVLNEEFNGVNLLMFYDVGSGTALAFNRYLDGKTYSFEHDSGSGADTVLVDDQTGTKWKAFTGVAIEGELKGKRLDPINTLPMYWRSWNNYYPGALVYKK